MGKGLDPNHVDLEYISRVHSVTLHYYITLLTFSRGSFFYFTYSHNSWICSKAIWVNYLAQVYSSYFLPQNKTCNVSVPSPLHSFDNC